jgi:hypothetical protein
VTWDSFGPGLWEGRRSGLVVWCRDGWRRGAGQAHGSVAVRRVLGRALGRKPGRRTVSAAGQDAEPVRRGVGERGAGERGVRSSWMDAR